LLSGFFERHGADEDLFEEEDDDAGLRTRGVRDSTAS
jgi:hypothetical protein